MLYLVYRMRLRARARQNPKEFWRWLEDREKFFYGQLDMIESLRWYYSVIGDVYVIENWAGFADEAAWGRYRSALANLKTDDSWESQRVSQDDWWEFLDTRIVMDAPCDVGFNTAEERIARHG